MKELLKKIRKVIRKCNYAQKQDNCILVLNQQDHLELSWQFYCDCFGNDEYVPAPKKDPLIQYLYGFQVMSSPSIPEGKVYLIDRKNIR